MVWDEIHSSAIGYKVINWHLADYSEQRLQVNVRVRKKVNPPVRVGFFRFEKPLS